MRQRLSHSHTEHATAVTWPPHIYYAAICPCRAVVTGQGGQSTPNTSTSIGTQPLCIIWPPLLCRAVVTGARGEITPPPPSMNQICYNYDSTKPIEVTLQKSNVQGHNRQVPPTPKTLLLATLPSQFLRPQRKLHHSIYVGRGV